MNESERMRKLIATLQESFESHWTKISCVRCNGEIAEISSSDPVPSLYCPSCAKAARAEQTKANAIR